MLRVENVSFAVGGSSILQHVEWHVRPGAFVGVVGPNGAGKTTLMRVAAGLLAPTSGRVLFEGGSVHELPEGERARSIAFMSQNPGIGFGFTVQDVVNMGRYAHRPPWWRRAGRRRSVMQPEQGQDNGELTRSGSGTGRAADGSVGFGRDADRGLGFGGDADRSLGFDKDADQRLGLGNDPDRRAIEQAMAATEVSHLRHRIVTTLSGGERQRVFLARTLAQQPRLLFLDEPTSDLDVRFQLEMLELIRRLHREQHLTVVVALHDLTWALRYCDEIVALQEGRVAAAGPARDVLTEGLIRNVFGVEARVEPASAGGPRVDFVGRSAG